MNQNDVAPEEETDELPPETPHAVLLAYRFELVRAANNCKKDEDAETRAFIKHRIVVIDQVIEDLANYKALKAALKAALA